MNRVFYYGKEALQIALPYVKKGLGIITRGAMMAKAEYDSAIKKIRRKRRMRIIKSLIGVIATFIGIFAAVVACVALIKGTPKKRCFFK